MLKLFLQNSDVPLDICLFFLISGALFLGSQKFKKLGRRLVVAGILLIIILSTAIVPSLLLSQLENKFPSVISVKDLGSTASEIKYVVILGGLAKVEKDWPITSQLGSTMLMRFTEGMRLLKELPHARLILSGGSRDTISDAEMMRRLAIAMGVESDRIILETKSANTAEEALYLKPLLNGEKFILVTSARHMPRAEAIFRRAGLNSIPAPTGHLVAFRDSFEWQDILPRSSNMTFMIHVFYEYMGMLKARFTGTI